MKKIPGTIPLKLVLVTLLTAMLAACTTLSKSSHPPQVSPPLPSVQSVPPLSQVPPPITAPPLIAPPIVGAAAPPKKPNNIIPVLFATNRNRTSSANPYYFYGNEILKENDGIQLQRGIALIRVPPKRLAGEIKRASLFSVTLERLTGSTAAQILHVPKITAENPETEFSYFKPIRELNQPEFDETLKAEVKTSKSKTAILYIHGYANDFTDAAFRTAQIAFDLATPSYDFVPLMFSWPSNPGLLGMNYGEARTKQVERSAYALQDFLKEIAATTDIGTVHIIAHSMGAEVLTRALESLSTPGLGKAQADNKPIQPVFRQIVFAAPDVTPDLFKRRIAPAIKTNHTITTYGAQTDLALKASSFKSGERRFGSALVGIENVDMVDVTAATRKGSLSHSTWADEPPVLEDLRLVLRDGMKPASRGLIKRDPLDNFFWKLPGRTR